MKNNQEIKEKVLSRVANGKQWKKVSGGRQEKWQIVNRIVHVKYRTRPSPVGVYSYNINPNPLEADYEIWICGDTEKYYLIPTNVMQTIYKDPDAYIDHTHPEIRIADVDVVTHRCRYARNRQKLDFSAYYQAVL
jgi:hypothetical protein